MQCPNCQHEMLTSKIGMLCLNCGHVATKGSKTSKVAKPKVAAAPAPVMPSVPTPPISITEVKMAAPVADIPTPTLPESPLHNSSPRSHRPKFAFAVVALLLVGAGGALGYQRMVIAPKQAQERQAAEQARIQAEAQAKLQAEAAAKAKLKAEAETRDEQRKADLKAISDALAAYAKSNTNRYPTTLDSLATKYLKTIPTDPTTGKAYGYTTANSRRAFTVTATLEIKKDPKATDSSYSISKL